MGKFVRLESTEVRRHRNHKRTLVMSVTIPTAHVKLLADAVSIAKFWSGEEISANDGISEVVLSYGPVYGAYPSDFTRFLQGAGVRVLSELTTFDSFHDDSCEHHTHDH